MNSTSTTHVVVLTTPRLDRPVVLGTIEAPDPGEAFAKLIELIEKSGVPKYAMKLKAYNAIHICDVTVHISSADSAERWIPCIRDEVLKAPQADNLRLS